MYEWVIIGGGVHGCTIATYLLKNRKTTSDQLLIIDPNQEPLQKWKRNTNLIGMEFLRSPSVHHMDMDPLSLHKYAKAMEESRAFYGMYDRPALHLFNGHSEEILRNLNIFHSWYRGKVIQVRKDGDVWKVKTENGEIITGKNLVISVSVNDQLNIPEWAFHAKEKDHAPVYHIFGEDLPDLHALPTPITVVGGGITAAHLTIKMARIYPGKVTLLKRHPFRVHPFDSDPGWLGPKNMSSFEKVQDYTLRRSIIQKARYKGSIPRELHLMLKKLQAEEKIGIVTGEIDSISEGSAKECVIHLKENEVIKGRAVILATGFQSSIPQRDWIQELINNQQLKCAKCGYPIVKETLEWCDHLYVSGALAELEIGPVARNISGAKRAAERIVASI